MTLNVSSLRRGLLLPITFASLALAGCSTPRFATSYYIDPKPPRASYSDLAAPANPSAVVSVCQASGWVPGATAIN